MMASSNQYSRGLKFFLASLVLLFFFAIAAESRAVSFNAPLLPELTGQVKKGFNSKYVGQALGYVALRGHNAFGVYVLALHNINPSSVSRVSLYYTKSVKKVIANLTYDSDAGLYTLDKRVNYTIGANIHEHETSVGVWVTQGKKEKLAITGPLSNNRTTFLAYLQASELVTTPSGTTKNQGFASIHLHTPDAVNYYVTAAINHDLASSQKVSSIVLNGPAPSGTDNDAWSLTLETQNQAGRVFSSPVNSTVYYWIANHLTYIKIKTAKNPNGALRGQLVSMSSPRARIPTFPNGFTQLIHGNEVTFLPDGSTIIGNLTYALLSGGARPTNTTIGTLDDRVAYFFFNNASGFNYTFRFPLPVTLANRYNTRGAVFVISAAAEVVDTNKWNVGFYNLADAKVDTPSAFPGLGNRTYTTGTAELSPVDFTQYLGPGGVYVRVTATAVTNPFFVDRFYTIYYVANALSNSIVRRIFASTSAVQNGRRRR